MMPSGDWDALDTYHQLTNFRPWGIFSGEKLTAAMRDYGAGAVDEALRAVHALDGDRKTLLDRTLAKLARDADRAKRAKPPTSKSRPKLDEEAYNAARRELLAATPEENG